MVIFGVLSSNSFDITAMQMYIDPASVVITFGGSICSTIGCFKLADGINGFKSISLPFKDKTYDPSQTIRTIIDMSNVGRKEGLLALEEAANGIEDEFLKKGIMLVVDGTDPELQAWQWEELLETGIQMVIGQAAMLEEVLVLPLVVYPEWLNRLAELETQAHRNE